MDKWNWKHSERWKMYMKYGERVVVIRYYNVLFYMLFHIETDNLKMDCLKQMINNNETLRMQTIYKWCKIHRIPFQMKFQYRFDYTINANIWNLYSYCRFRCGIIERMIKRKIELGNSPMRKN